MRWQKPSRSTSCSLTSHSTGNPSGNNPPNRSREYIDRKDLVWARARDALQSMGGKPGPEENVAPLHGHLR
eukprot:11182765-Lingulodinium_polyedra.AAC.1